MATKTTIQERLQQLCEILKMNPQALSTAAGLSRGYIHRILNSSDYRKGLNPDDARRLAFVAKCSLSWLLYGEGHPFANHDVPNIAPPPKRGVARERLPYWIATAKRALEIDPTLAWALMGVGEQYARDAAEVLSAYEALAQAEHFRASCDDNAERIRLARKARLFVGQHLPAPKGKSDVHPQRGGTAEQIEIEPLKKRRSGPTQT